MNITQAIGISEREGYPGEGMRLELAELEKDHRCLEKIKNFVLKYRHTDNFAVKEIMMIIKEEEREL